MKVKYNQVKDKTVGEKIDKVYDLIFNEIDRKKQPIKKRKLSSVK